MRRRWLVLGGVALIGVVGAVSGVVLLNAGRTAQDGKRNLVDAQSALGRQDLRTARVKLAAAQASFHDARHGIRRLGPLLPVLRMVPLVRVQVRGAETFTKVGENVSAAGLKVVDATDSFLHGEPGSTTGSASAASLRPLLAALTDARGSLDGAARDLSHLNGKRLLGPLGTARADFAQRIPRVQKQLASADDGLRAFIDFAGGSGPRRYLVFSQNPDELRPTGGFIGTYGVLAANDKGLSLERYASIESWYLAHPDAVVPVADAPAALRFSEPPKAQALVNVNASPDWPTASRLAMDLWAKGGEQPVDGAVS